MICKKYCSDLCNYMASFCAVYVLSVLCVDWKPVGTFLDIFKWLVSAIPYWIYLCLAIYWKVHHVLLTMLWQKQHLTLNQNYTTCLKTWNLDVSLIIQAFACCHSTNAKRIIWSNNQRCHVYYNIADSQQLSKESEVSLIICLYFTFWFVFSG